MAEESEKQTVIWNAAAFQVQEVTKYLTRSTEHYLRGDLGQWFYVLTAVREMIDHDLDEPTAKELDQMEKKCSSYLRRWNAYKKGVEEGKPLDKQTTGKTNYVFAKLVKLYGRRVKQELRELGYFPTKSMREKVTF